MPPTPEAPDWRTLLARVLAALMLTAPHLLASVEIGAWFLLRGRSRLARVRAPDLRRARAPDPDTHPRRRA